MNLTTKAGNLSKRQPGLPRFIPAFGAELAPGVPDA